MSQDQFTVSADNLLAQFEWLYVNDFHPVSLDDLLAAQKGKKVLPDKAVLLSFDDGYLSFYGIIHPLLRLYNYPAIFALVGSWLEVPEDGKVQYGNKNIDRENFLTWPQIKEMQDSGLIEFASHSYDLHKGIIGNPQMNTQPAAITRKYSPATQEYETDDEYRARIHSDLARNSALLEKHIGKKPRIMVWPYGTYNQESKEIAAALGMETNLFLNEEKPNKLGKLQDINRYLMKQIRM